MQVEPIRVAVEIQKAKRASERNFQIDKLQIAKNKIYESMSIIESELQKIANKDTDVKLSEEIFNIATAVGQVEAHINGL